METIVKNEKYEVRFDKSKNRLFYTFTGFWETPDVVVNLMDDCKKGLDQMSSGFTLLVNLSAIKTPSKDVRALFVELQQITMGYNPGRIAEVMDSMMVKVNVDETHDISGVKTKQFDSVEKATQWLDE
jgi:hypothetical protein